MIRRATALLSLCLATALPAQQQRIVTAADYAHAERFLAPTTSPLVFGAGVRPTWLSGDRFWYRTTKPNGVEFIVVDPATGSRSRAFDQAKLAAGLTAATGTAVDSAHLPFTMFEYTPDGRAMYFIDTPTCRVDVFDYDRATGDLAIPQRADAARRWTTAKRRPQLRLGAVQGDEPNCGRPTASGPRSSATTTSGCATSPPAPSRSSRATA